MKVKVLFWATRAPKPSGVRAGSFWAPSGVILGLHSGSQKQQKRRKEAKHLLFCSKIIVKQLIEI